MEGYKKTMTMQLSSSSMLLHFILLFVVCSLTKAVVKLPPNISIPAILAFGDSILDTGNNNYMSTLVKCNFPPYGKDFQEGIPTGRFSNGKVISDLLELGIKDYLPAYLDPNLNSDDLVSGVCFASGGSGYDPLTPEIMAVISLSSQVELLKEYIWKLQQVVGDDRINFILANSLFVVGGSSNDLYITYFLTHARQDYDVSAYTDLMLNSSSNL